MLGIAGVGVGVIALCAFMAHGDDGRWVKNTGKMAAVLGVVIGVLLLVAWVMTAPGDSMWGSN